MGEYFNGWRRKCGLVTLVMACAVAGMWMRSIFFGDLVLFGRFEALSQDGQLSWALGGEPSLPPTFTALNLWMKFQIGGQLRDSVRYIHPGTPVHYAIVAVPLLLISAYLLLSKPRRANSDFSPKKTGESII